MNLSAIGRAIVVIRERPGTVMAFALGAVFGTLLCAPLFTWKLGADASTVVGASLGALIGAGAAAVIAEGIANRSERDNRNTFLLIIEEVYRTLRNVQAQLAHAADDLEGARESLQYFCECVLDTHGRLELIAASNPRLKGRAALAVVDARAACNDLKKLKSQIDSFIAYVIPSASPEKINGGAEALQDQMRGPANKLESCIGDLR